MADPPKKSPKKAPQKSPQRVFYEQVDDCARNERQKAMLLLEHRHILKTISKNLVEQSQALITKTKELIADSKQGITKTKLR